MNNKKKMHNSVLLKESIKELKIKKDGLYIDATFGYGGHSKLILKSLNDNGMLYAFDQDPDAIAYAHTIKSNKIKIFHTRFSQIYKIACNENINGKVDGILIDLGMSNVQLQTASRGFSFMKDGLLDMRMNPQLGIPAFEWLNKEKEKNIAAVIKNFGEERFYKKIAYNIVQQAKKKPITRTIDLVNIIQRIIPKKTGLKHPATRTFQAIRIYINEELNEVNNVLLNAVKVLKKNGRIAIISFHSLEDRIIKKFMNNFGKMKEFPSNMPINEIQKKHFCKPILKIFKKIKPSQDEIYNNPSARSAILRVAEKK
ncbi:Ribosomal RNA small subunit methyltransferase H [Buchnera aphidicola (Thelaxes suberi)]|uniref:16S rRNA (cytosine(1402)-N(4))-methyltransferase RsmH n=1 Tax=Buchnera aphidicola TaxID=9 RepID=UPI003463B5F0